MFGEGVDVHVALTSNIKSCQRNSKFKVTCAHTSLKFPWKMNVAFHDASGRPFERHVLLVRQYGMHGFDCCSANGCYGAELRQRYRDGLMSDDEKSALREMKFNFTYYGTYPCITYPNLRIF